MIYIVIIDRVFARGNWKKMNAYLHKPMMSDMIVDF